MNSGSVLWNKAKKLIPGGNQLLSKRSEMFLPDQWPSYYKKAQGIEVWDLDDYHYFDMSIMGMGACVLGYAHPSVNEAVKKAVEMGSMCTLNCYEEVELAEKLIELHPWSQMVRFARTGGEACAIAVRIARAASQRDKIAFCGYHGWHDWYLSSNLSNSKNLDGQLLHGLEPKGVPRNLQNTVFPFHYGKLDELQKLVIEHKNEIGVIIMEVQRHESLDLDFLKQVRKAASHIGAVLIFDEVSSGFRLRTGGLHMLYGVEPDVVVLGKALGNGYPISAIIGRKEVMEAAQTTFISSTAWTERIGFAAALEVINQFEKNSVASHLIEIGQYLTTHLKKIFVSQGLRIDIVGLASAPHLVIKEAEPLLIKTIFTQEMRKRGFLASTLSYISFAHTKEIIDEYLQNTDEVSDFIITALKSGNLFKMLEGPVCHSGFKRLT